MSVGRVRASATLLLDKRVLVAGGNDGTNDLATAEIFYPAGQIFDLTTTNLTVARSSHAAMLLPWNGSVLIAGGSSNGVVLSSSDLFLPPIFPDPFSYGVGEFRPTGALNATRTGASLGPTPTEGIAFVAQGMNLDPNGAAVPAATAESYRFATIRTDKDDYAPGAHAIITGQGWKPGEEVTLLFQEDPAVHTDYTFTLTADASGQILWDGWAPEPHDANVRFYLTATGEESQAQTTFTDNPSWQGTVAPGSAPANTAQGFTITGKNIGGSQATDPRGCFSVTLPAGFTNLSSFDVAKAVVTATAGSGSTTYGAELLGQHECRNGDGELHVCRRREPHGEQ